jgi:hypothetical protein
VSRLIALVLQLQQARMFEETSTQARHFEWWQKLQIVPKVGEESSKYSTLILFLQKINDVRAPF